MGQTLGIPLLPGIFKLPFLCRSQLTHDGLLLLCPYSQKFLAALFMSVLLNNPLGDLIRVYLFEDSVN